MAKKLICIPTYNEKENIAPLLEKIYSYTENQDFDVLFIDDASPDGTAALIEELQFKDQRIHLLKRPGKLGLGTAYLQAFNWALERSYELIVEMDADFSHDPQYLKNFTSLILDQGSDVAIGSRYISGGGVVNWSRMRYMISRIGSIYSTLILQRFLYDWTGGFNGWSRKALMSMSLHKVASKGYAFQVELKYRAIVRGLRVKEFPIIFQERRAGQSKMSGNIVKEAILRVALLRWKQLTSQLF